MKKWRINSFFVIFGLTALVWFTVSVSEYREYPLRVDISMSGYDANRYALLSADSAITLQVQASGLSALMSAGRSPIVLQVDMADDAVRRHTRPSPSGGEGLHCRSVCVDDLSESFRSQLGRYGVRGISPSRDSLRLVLAPRAGKRVKVSIDNLRVSFADGYGLYGEPSVVPSEVVLYGPQEVLDGIVELQVSPTEVTNVHSSDSLWLPLDPVWERSGDVAPSATRVQVFLPVQPYVERRYTLPVKVARADTSLRLQLYPAQVEVLAWVAWSELSSVSASSFEVEADYADVQSNRPHLEPKLVRFPEHVRVRSVQPSEIQYVVIQ